MNRSMPTLSFLQVRHFVVIHWLIQRCMGRDVTWHPWCRSWMNRHNSFWILQSTGYQASILDDKSVIFVLEKDTSIFFRHNLDRHHQKQCLIVLQSYLHIWVFISLQNAFWTKNGLEHLIVFSISVLGVRKNIIINSYNLLKHE